VGHALSEGLTEIAIWLATGPLAWLAIATIAIDAVLLVNSTRPRTDTQRRYDD